MVNKNRYFNFLVTCLEREVEKEKGIGHSSISIDVNEVSMLLEFMKQAAPNTFDHFEFAACHVCQREIPIERVEQLVINQESNEIVVKCLHCLIDTLKKDQTELQQISAISWFLKEHNLEEDFELYLSEINQH